MELMADDAMEERRSRSRSRRASRWPPLATVAAVTVVGMGGWMATRSITALVARTEQLERDAAESEARVAELQALRDGMARRVRRLEQQREEAARQRARRAGEAGVAQARRETARVQLESLLQPERERGAAFLEAEEDGLRVELADPLLFTPRGTALTPEGAALLSRVGTQLAVTGHLVQVKVYTDARPEPSAAEPSPTSWELSSARAVAVARYLAETVKLAPERLVAMGHGTPAPERPAAPVPALSRRLELRLVPAPLASRKGPGTERPPG